MQPIPSADGSLYFCECGLLALRDEKTGGFQDPVSIFLAVPGSEINGAGTQTKGEDDLCADISRALAQKYGAYVRGLRELERLQKSQRR